ncbi:MAG: N-methyl-L-tryptophan oxidase [Jatrophihabitans sp.]
MTRRFRYAVVGGGGIGSATAYWLSKTSGEDVLCLEQWEHGHARGASEDHSRIIRLGYHAARYTALTRDSYTAWQVAERESGVQLVHRTGMVNLARPGTEGGGILDNYEHAMSAYDIPYQRFDAREVMRRWPQFHLDGEYDAVFQADGGILDIRKAVAVHLALARGHGATVLPNAEVTAIDDSGDVIRLRTSAGDFEAERVVLCAGAWTAQLLETQLGIRWPIRLTQEQVTYFATPHVRRFAADRFPIWIWHGEQEYYGFPVYGEVATKAAQEVCGESVGLDAASWAPDQARVRRVADFVERILPGYSGPELYTRCCLYDMAPDRDFVIDVLPGHPNIAVGIGAGHAAKFAGLFGRILAELSTDGRTGYPIEAFRADRPAMVDPDYEPGYRLGAPVAAG